MRFKQQKPTASTEVNLVPMLDVMMSVLTFFIVVSLTFTAQRVSNVELPSTTGEGGGVTAGNPTQLVIGFNRQGEIILAQTPVSEVEMLEEMRVFLENAPEGEVILKADRQLDYGQVAQLLLKMGEVGGSRVSLALDRID
ncbi:biopolymer transporter ExbD [Spirulina subsalsa FACHB-351]|uniref:Biopolymer transporter ExbD n=1 Tax=Spirulina subsalsa FACHB-351 TaxID=234711 RepID=A0ABT3L7K9_9CYAN|nr:biopolymer transporter ExbD [Spirulina subsalsa]MCW6037491.1 biopolymer transporter ExbD [Spirulina subsalsa FACHB-351]